MPSDLEAGKAVFLANCAGCHGTDGTGHSPGGRALRPVAFNLAGFHISPAVVWGALQHGVPGTSMPAWNELSGAEFKAVGDYVLSLANTPELRPGEQWATQDTLLLAGQRIFDTHCTLATERTVPETVLPPGCICLDLPISTRSSFPIPGLPT